MPTPHRDGDGGRGDSEKARGRRGGREKKGRDLRDYDVEARLRAALLAWNLRAIAA